MTFAQVTHTVYDASQGFGEALIVLLVVAVAVTLHAILQRRIKTEVLRRHNDVAGFLFSAVGVLYAVVLGFVVVVVWQKYDASVANVETEVAAISDAYRVVGAYPAAPRSQIRAELREYTAAVIGEWEHHDQQEAGSDVALAEHATWLIDTYQAKTAAESNAQQTAMAQMERMFDARRQREVEAAPSVPFVLWLALIAGALAMLAFAYLFGSENQPAQLAMTAILAGLIAILFIVISEFDSPFSGSVSISDDGWVYLQQRFDHIP